MQGQRWHVSFLVTAICCVAMLGSQPSAADAPTAGKLFDADKLTMLAAERSELATTLGTYARNNLDFSDPANQSKAAKFLAVALTLDPKNKIAYVANAQLQQGRAPGKVDGVESTPEIVTDRLLTAAGNAKDSTAEADRSLAAHLYSLVLEINQDHEDAVFELGMLKEAGVEVAWKPGAAGTSSAPQTADVSAAEVIPDGDILLALSFDKGTVTEQAGQMQVSDVSGKQIRATVKGASLAPGRIGEAMQFDDDSQFVEVAHSPALSPAQNLTTAAWVKPFGERAGATVIDKHDWKDQSTHGYVLRVMNGLPNFSNGRASKWLEVQSGAKLPQGEWTHLAATFDGKLMKLYVNGEMVASAQSGGAMEPSSYPLRIGGSTFDASDKRAFVGLVDEARVAKRAISDDEVAILAGKKEPESRAVNLLALIDTERDAVQGEWTITKDGLMSDGGKNSRIHLTSEVPAEYDFRIEFTRTEGNEGPYQILAAGTSAFAWVTAAWEGSIAGFQMIDGKDVANNPTTFKAQNLIKSGKRHTSLVKVRKNSVLGYLDGKLLAEFKGSRSRLSVHPENSIGLEALGVGSYESPTIFHVIELTPVSGTDELPVVAETTTDEATIERPEYRNTPKPIVKSQSSIKAMMVRVSEDGQMMGTITDVIAIIPADARQQSNGEVRFVGEVGGEMNTSRDEAVRAVRMRYPQWGSGPIEISFGARYDKHDGGSAGAAFAILMLSILDGVELDPSIAVTGDLTVDWKVRKVTGIAAKLRGAQLDKTPYALIPAANADSVSDAALLHGPSLLWDVQVFSMATLQEGIATARSDRDAKVTEAMKLFADLRAKAAGGKAAPSAPVQEQLAKVLELAPNHVSAKHLVAMGKGQAPKTLSSTATIYQFSIISYPYRDVLFRENVRVGADSFPPSVTANTRKQITQLRSISDRNIQPLLAEFLKFVEICDRLNAGRGNASELAGQRKAVIGRLVDIQANREVMEKLIREGF